MKKKSLCIFVSLALIISWIGVSCLVKNINKKRVSASEIEAAATSSAETIRTKYLFRYPEIGTRDQLVELNTEELLAACLLYPSLPNYTAYALPTAIEMLIRQFIGAEELVKREDLLETTQAFKLEWVDFSCSGQYQEAAANYVLKGFSFYAKGELESMPR